MARGTSKATAAKEAKWNFKGFINYQFTAKEINQMLDYFQERTFDHSDTLEQWLSEGFKFSMSYDASRNCYIASFTAKTTGTDLDGWVVQFRHSDVHKLLCACGYAVNELWPNGAIKVPAGSDEEFGW